jgi:NAD(P)-dependent dehydrogenase (short-subunit alcohol dehydrogenase family)
MSKSDLSGKVIVVTGGKGLLGKAFVKHCKDAGAIAIAADIEAKGGKDEIALDITSEKSVQDAIKTIVKEHGHIDGWINSAYPRTDDWRNAFEDMPMESWKKNVDMHLNGYALCCKEVLKQMKKQKSGSLINIGSIYGVLGPDNRVYEGTDIRGVAAYAAIKGGILQLTKFLAVEYGKYGVRVNAISPGGVYDSHSEKFDKQYSARVPLGRMARPDDVAAPAVFLLSEAANYITGHNLLVDGGWTCI